MVCFENNREKKSITFAKIHKPNQPQPFFRILAEALANIEKNE